MSPTLRDSLIVLLAAAVLTGLVAPLVVGWVQTKNQKRLRSFEADVARQAKIIDDQGALLDRLADALWAYQLLLIAPLYYGQWGPGSTPERSVEEEESPYQKTKAEYFANAGMRLGNIRAEIGKAVRLVPAPTQHAMKQLYYHQLLKLDLDATRLLLDGPGPNTRSAWSNLQGRVLRELAEQIDEMLLRMAGDMDLRARFHEVNGVVNERPMTNESSQGPGDTAFSPEPV